MSASSSRRDDAFFSQASTNSRCSNCRHSPLLRIGRPNAETYPSRPRSAAVQASDQLQASAPPTSGRWCHTPHRRLRIGSLRYLRRHRVNAGVHPVDDLRGRYRRIYVVRLSKRAEVRAVVERSVILRSYCSNIVLSRSWSEFFRYLKRVFNELAPPARAACVFSGYPRRHSVTRAGNLTFPDRRNTTATVAHSPSPRASDSALARYKFPPGLHATAAVDRLSLARWFVRVVWPQIRGAVAVLRIAFMAAKFDVPWLLTASNTTDRGHVYTVFVAERFGTDVRGGEARLRRCGFGQVS